MTKLSIRRFLRPTTALQLALVLVVLASTSKWVQPVAAEVHVEHVQEQQQQQQEQHHEQPPPPEDPPQQEDAPPVEQEDPPVQEESAPVVEEEAVQEEVPPVQEEEAPVQEEPQEESPPVQEEAPPVQEEEPPVVEEKVEEPEEEEDPPIDDSLFEIKVFECMAPYGDPSPKRTEPVAATNPIMTLCVRPKNDSGETSLKSISLLTFSATRGPSQAAVRDNQSAGPMARAICPMQTENGLDDTLCIAATKLNDEFFTKAYKKASGAGQVVVEVRGVERTMPFEYKFSTSEAPKQQPVEHEYFEMPTTPPPFPCGNEIRIWLLAALILTLLEFAFTPDSEESGSKKSEGGSKKKKSKKEQ